MIRKSAASRRTFLKNSVIGGMAAVAALRAPHSVFSVPGAEPLHSTSRVSLTTGDDRADNIFRGLKNLETEIKTAIGKRRIIIKPNNVHTAVPLCATNAAGLEGILEFLKSIGKTDVTIAESAASAPTFEGYENYGYIPVAEKYAAKLVDLDQEKTELVYLVDENDFHPHKIRMSSLLLDPDNFVISAAVMKTHDRVVTTLSLKNIVFGAPIKDEGFRWGRDGKPGAKNDKPIAHGGGFKAVNFNLFSMAPRLAPDLAVIDGFQGMEGNGPVGGTPVDHKVAVVSMDWLAADRTAVELMGIDFAKVGYLNYCAQAGMGQGDLEKIEIIGPAIADHKKSYKLHDNVEKQLVWM
jgi:uncharacterized protein (DUF362 family)